MTDSITLLKDGRCVSELRSEGFTFVENGGSEFAEKIFSIEKRSSEQSIDISLLKSALADTLSRLCDVEKELKQVKSQMQSGSVAPQPDVPKRIASQPDVTLRNTPIRRPKSMINLSNGNVNMNQEERKNKKNSIEEAKQKRNNFQTKDDSFVEESVSKLGNIKENGVDEKKGDKGSGFGSTFYRSFRRNPPPSASRKSSMRRSQSEEQPSKAGRKDSREGSESKDDGKPKIILAKKISAVKKAKAIVNALEDSAPKSPKDDAIKFNTRGRAITLYPPTGFQEESADGSAPEKKLQLNWVYGYRGKDCRDNLYHLPTGEFLYNMAGVIIMHDVKANTQRHYTQHTEDVKCIAIHPNKVFIASGQVTGHGEDRKAHVLIWNSSTLETLSSFGQGHFERGLCAVEFSTYENGKYLIAFDESNDHVIYVYEWEKEIKITETKVSKEIIFGARWNPKSELSFVTYGKSHLMFWTFDVEQSYLTKKAAIYEKLSKPKYVQSLIYTDDGDLVSGDSNGNVLLFKDENSRNRVTESAISVHKGGVFSLCFIESNGTILSSGKDGQFSMWSKTLEKLADYSKISEKYGPARCMLYDSAEDIFTVSTSRNCILRYDGDLSDESVYVEGHFDEMWGLAVHPTEKLFASCALEQLVCVWNCETKRNVWDYYIEEAAECAEFHPDESYLLVGTKSGTIYFLNYVTKEEELSLPVSRDYINVIKVSPDGQAFAAGCRDANIYLYSWPNDINSLKKPKILQGHSSRVIHLDWSSDSEYLQSNSTDYELLFWQREAGLQVLSPAALRDMPWSTWTCPFGFPAIGIWPEGADGTDINTCSRSFDKKLIATGDDFGEVKLFRHPSAKLRSDFNVGNGHSAHVTCVRFLVDDYGLVSIGGRDCSIMQWDIV